MTDHTLRSITEQIVSLLTQLPLSTLKVLVPAAQSALAHKQSDVNAMSATQSLAAAQTLLAAMQAMAQPVPSGAVGTVTSPSSSSSSSSPASHTNTAAALVCPNCGADVLLPDPENRWYAIIRGTRVGWVCNATIAEAYTVGVSNGLRIWQPDEASCRED